MFIAMRPTRPAERHDAGRRTDPPGSPGRDGPRIRPRIVRHRGATGPDPLHARLSARLLRAYRGTTYTAAGIEVRIGRRNAALDALLRAHGAREGVLITAWNPRSRRMPERWNHRAQDRLNGFLRRVATMPA